MKLSSLVLILLLVGCMSFPKPAPTIDNYSALVSALSDAQVALSVEEMRYSLQVWGITKGIFDNADEQKMKDRILELRGYVKTLADELAKRTAK